MAKIAGLNKFLRIYYGLVKKKYKYANEAIKKLIIGPALATPILFIEYIFDLFIFLLILL